MAATITIPNVIQSNGLNEVINAVLMMPTKSPDVLSCVLLKGRPNADAFSALKILDDRLRAEYDAKI